MSSKQSLGKPAVDLLAMTWSPQPAAANLVNCLIEEFLKESTCLNTLSKRLLDETGTRLIDWIDCFELPVNHFSVDRLISVGYEVEPRSDGEAFVHRAGLFPRIRFYAQSPRRILIKVESVVDFLFAHQLSQISIQGGPLSAIRRAIICHENGIEIWVIERHGSMAFEVPPNDDSSLGEILHHSEVLKLRRRDFDSEDSGFDCAIRLIQSAIDDLGKGRACELFFAAERDYWLRRNAAGRIQKARQDSFGMGWANHDHHTYRSSRSCFSRLIGFFELLGFECRERFYAGHEAGWGAQVIEHPLTGITVFADVDLSEEELCQDFAHEPLAPRDRLGTVGLWCALHGEAFLQAGMHHLECQFDFDYTREQLTRAGIETMPPFTNFPYLKQAFTKGEIWQVRADRVQRLLDADLITIDQAQQFLTLGALGSHLEILQRDDGYKGFNQQGINQIISATDPRRSQQPGTLPADN